MGGIEDSYDEDCVPPIKSPQPRSTLGDVLSDSEDRGAQAVMNALRRLGVVRYQHEDRTLHFKDRRVAWEALNMEIRRELPGWRS